MNSRALVKMNEQSWMERALGARGARALLAATGTAILVLSVPVTLLEHFSTASGISELLPNLAPPLGIRARIALAVALALVAVAIVWVFWGRRPAIKEPDSMIQARKASPDFGWGALVRLVRGETVPETDAQHDLLSRRRRDRHPDAPPRPPLVASRDLPPPMVQILELVASDDPGDAPPIAEPEAPFVEPAPHALSNVPPVRPVSHEEQDVPSWLPRSPEPMSEAEIARTMAAMPSRNADPFFDSQAVRPAPTFQGESHCSRLARDLPLIDGADIATLAERFEQGVARRELVRHAEVAQRSLDSSMAFVQPDPSVRAALRALRPVEVVTMSDAMAWAHAEEAPGSTMRVDEDVEAALNTALATLRKLTEAGRR